MVDPTVILAGAIPAAALALAIDGGLTWLERVVSRSLSGHRVRRSQLAIVLVFLLGGGVLVGAALIRGRDSDVVRIGSKNFTEQIVLGEIVAQAVEAAGLRVERRLNLGGTFICDRAIRTGDIDAYVDIHGDGTRGHLSRAHEYRSSAGAGQGPREVR